MKDYNCTKIWASTIADISADIDSRIEWLGKELADQEATFTNAEPDSNEKRWALESVEEIREKISSLDWCLKALNAPFKIKK